MNKNINTRYWMEIVNQVAKASTCRVEVGCILVQNKIIIGMGYVGSIAGDIHCNDEGVDCLELDNYGIHGSEDRRVSCYRTVHAEMNAVLKCYAMLYGRDIECYSTYSPCLNCLKALLSIGVRRFIFQKHYRDLYRDHYLENLHINIQKTIVWQLYKKEE